MDMEKAPQDFFYIHIKTIVGDGRHTNLFYDTWLPSGQIAEKIGRSIQLWGETVLVAQWRQNDRWIIPTSFMRRFPALAQEIENTTLTQQQDKYIWSISPSGTYSITSFYNHFRVKCTKVTWNRLVWSGNIPQKYRFIFRLLIRQRLKSREFLLRRGMNVVIDCVFCSTGNDSCQHLFFRCPYSSEVWSSILRRMVGIQRRPLAWEAELNWLRRICKGRSIRSKTIRLILFCTVYCLWCERNGRIFKQQSRSPEAFVAFIIKIVNLIK